MADSDDLDAVVGLAMARADALRGAGLEGLHVITEARQAALEREQARLTQKLGAEHPATQLAALRLASGVTRLRELGAEIARARTPAPEPGEGGWVLHGYVLREDRSPAPELTVSMVDDQGAWLRPLGFACTDARGYFRLEVKVLPAGGEAPPAAPVAGRPETDAFVWITDRNGIQLYRGDDPLEINAGRVEYREIVLDGGAGGRCVPPEPKPESTAPEPMPPEVVIRRRAAPVPKEPPEQPRPPGTKRRRK